MKSFDESLEFDALYESMWKCKRGKMWKASVARFVVNGIDSTLKLEEELQSGKYHPRKPHTFTLTYPKVRPCSSMHIRDRVVQRSLNDNLIYPKMTKSFIWDNFACQKGKGTTHAMDRMKRFLRRYYINHNNSNNGYVLQCDIQGYYRNMQHDDAKQCFSKHLDEKTVDTCFEWLEYQYPRDKGYDPGSQMIQILGISLLDDIDHFAKEQLLCRIYERYMDDFIIISDNKEYLVNCRNELEKQLEKHGMRLHPKKTRIYRLSDGIPFLGFTFYLKKTGKVVLIIDPKNVKHERLRLYRMAQLVKKGERTKAKFYECLESWIAHANLGSSYKLVQRIRKYADGLMKGVT